MKRAILLLTLCLAGCHATADRQAATCQAQVSDSIATVAEPIARAEVRREIAAEDIKDTDKTVAKQQLAAQKLDLDRAKTALRVAKTTAQTQLDQSETRRQAAVTAQVKAEEATIKLSAKWYAVAGRWIERLILWVIVTYVSLGIGGILLCAFGGPWGLLAGREILGLLPVANIFTNAARWLGKN